MHKVFTRAAAVKGVHFPACEVIVLDSSELMQAYVRIMHLSGKSNSRGGYNLLEPIAAGVPVFSGPSVYNFKFIAETHTVGALQLFSNSS